MGVRGRYVLELICDAPDCGGEHNVNRRSQGTTNTTCSRVEVVAQDNQKALQAARKKGWQITTAVRCPYCAGLRTNRRTA
jgi:hypothetical protein